MQRLVAGIHQFRSDYFRSRRALFEKLSQQGQRPETLFITCSDARIVPNLITSTAPGELFTVRNVGNIVPAVHRGVIGGVAAAIEYAVCVLDVNTVVVCGHTQCGAIDTILRPESTRHLRFVSRWLDESSSIPRLIDEKYGELPPERRMDAAVQENVLAQLENLRTYDFVSERMDQGKLHIMGWVYRIATGDVFEYEPESEQFLPIGGGDSDAPLTRRPTDAPPPVPPAPAPGPEK
jgi:carbonic anhydrase